MATLSQMVREFQVALQAPAGNGPSIDRIRAVTRVATELYDEREEGTAGCYRKLEVFEALFISAVASISKDYSKQRADGHRTWGDGQAYAALCNLLYREQADAMDAALASYKRARDEFYNASLDEVSFQLAAE